MVELKYQQTNRSINTISLSFLLAHSHEFTKNVHLLYESGLSIRDIEEQTGIPKTTIRETLKKRGMALCNPQGANASKIDRTKNKRGGNTPYGYAYLDGQLLVDPKEQIIVRKIVKLHQSGLSGNVIARELNTQKIPGRNGKSWCPSVVRGIIKNHLSDQKKDRRNK